MLLTRCLPNFWDQIFFSNISAITYLISTKNFWTQFFGVLSFLDQQFFGQSFLTNIFFWLKYFGTNIFLLFGPKYCLYQQFIGSKKIYLKFFGSTLSDPKYFGPQIFLTIFLDLNFSTLKNTTTTVTIILMGFDTIEINLVICPVPG